MQLSPVIRELDFGSMFLIALFLSKNVDMMKVGKIIPY